MLSEKTKLLRRNLGTIESVAGKLIKKNILKKKIRLEQKIKNLRGSFIDKNLGYGFVLCNQPIIAYLIINSFEGLESFGVNADK